MRKSIVSLFVCLFVSISYHAQDAHWSQPVNLLLYQNPAFTGINNKFSINTGFRNQWKIVNTNYKSYLVSGDYRFRKSESGNVSLSAGSIVYSYVAGDGNYRITNGGLTFSCIVESSARIRLGAGFGVNIIQSALQANRFTWGSQFNGQNYDASISPAEGYRDASRAGLDLNAGIVAVYNKSETTTAANTSTSFVFGYSINHLNSPNISMYSNDGRLSIKHVVFASGNISLKNNIALKPSFLLYRQNTLNEVILGTLLCYTMGQTSLITGYKKGSTVSFGILYRVKDAIIPTVEMEIKNCVLGICYDINVSKLSTFSNYRGGIEFTLRLINPSNYLYKEHNEIRDARAGKK